MQTQIDKKLNGIDTDAMRRTMDAVSSDPAKGMARFRVSTRWEGGTRSETRVDGWGLGGEWLPKDFAIAIDEPPELLGTNTAPNPQEYLLAAMNACMMATYVGACAIRGVELDSLEIEAEGDLDLRGFLGLDSRVKPGYDELRYTVRVKGRGTQEQFRGVHEWVMARSPNYWNMAYPIRMVPHLVIQ